jgi:trans-aconitate 2-methyltransferase
MANDEAERTLEEIARAITHTGRLAIVEFKKQESPMGPPLSIKLSPKEVEGPVKGYGFSREQVLEVRPHHYSIFSGKDELKWLKDYAYLQWHQMQLWADTMHKWDPEVYEKSSSTQKKWAEEVISRIQLKENERILDIGCGDGKITAYIASLVPEGSVVGIDNSTEMISFAQSKFPPSRWPNLSFQYGNASDLRYQDEFDLIVSFACLHWLLDHKPVLEGIKRSLKFDGRLFIQFGGRGNADEVLKVVDRKISEERWARYFRDFAFPYGFFGPEIYEDWLEQVGLKATRVELIPKDMMQPGAEGLASWIGSTWLPYIERIPDELRHEFIYEIVSGYISVHPLSHGQVHVRMVRLEVEAEKV